MLCNDCPNTATHHTFEIYTFFYGESALDGTETTYFDWFTCDEHTGPSEQFATFGGKTWELTESTQTELPKGK